MPEKFVDKINKVGNTIDEFLDKLPDDDKIAEKIAAALPQAEKDQTRIF